MSYSWNVLITWLCLIYTMSINFSFLMYDSLLGDKLLMNWIKPEWKID